METGVATGNRNESSQQRETRAAAGAVTEPGCWGRGGVVAGGCGRGCGRGSGRGSDGGSGGGGGWRLGLELG